MAWGDMFFWPFATAFVLLKFVIAVVVLVFVIWMIIDCAQRKFKVDAEKWVWLVLLVFLTLVGVGSGLIVAIVYYIFIRALNPRGLSKK
jgi:hypothetical protein